MLTEHGHTMLGDGGEVVGINEDAEAAFYYELQIDILICNLHASAILLTLLCVAAKKLLQKNGPLNQYIQLFSKDFCFSDFANSPESQEL